MSLFVGNINRAMSARDLHELFDRFGKCTVDVKGNFGFVDFEQVRAAEQAKNALHNKEIMGSVVNVEWSRNNKRIRPPKTSFASKTVNRGEIECYVCHELGHMAKDCKYQERDENGHKMEADVEAILNSVRKNDNSRRARLKSPDRYAKHIQASFNVLRGL